MYAHNTALIYVFMLICGLFIEPLSVLNFNGYEVESGAIINTFPSTSVDYSSSSSGSGFINYKELTLMCSTLNSDGTVRWMVSNSSSNDSFTVDEAVVNRSLSKLTVRISEGELTVACISEEHNESINITITTGRNLLLRVCM